MTNDEIDIRLKRLSEALPNHAIKIGLIKKDIPSIKKIAGELELLNMSMFAVWTMLGEIAKRLPEENDASS